MKGRKPISNAVRKLHGTDRADRVRNEITVSVMESVDAKKIKMLHTRRSREIFTVKANQLIDQGILTELDLETLAIYSCTLDIVFDCAEKLNQEGRMIQIETEKGKATIPNPHLKLYREMVDIVNRIGADFGFTPVSRAKIQAPPKEENELADLLNQFND